MEVFRCSIVQKLNHCRFDSCWFVIDCFMIVLSAEWIGVLPREFAAVSIFWDFTYASQILSIRAVPRTVIHGPTPSDTYQSNDALWITKCVRKREVDTETMSSNDALIYAVCSPYGLRVADKGLDGVVAILA